jgi:hypothetical protein
VGRNICTPRARPTEGLEDLDEGNAELVAEEREAAGEGTQARRLLPLMEVGRTDHEGAPGSCIHENRLCVAEGILKVDPWASRLRRRVIRAEGKNDATVDLGWKTTQDLVTPATMDVCARVTTHTEVVVRDEAPSPGGASAHPPRPTEAFGVAGPLHEGVSQKADPQVARRDLRGALGYESHRNLGDRFSVNAATASLCSGLE